MLVIVLVAAGVAGWWFYPRWRQRRATPAAVPPPASTATSSTTTTPAAGRATAAVGAAVPAACWSPGPLGSSALQLSKQARFATVEQLLGNRAPAPGRVYRVQARLTAIAQQPDHSYLLNLTSLVDPQRQLSARLPAGQCVANREDAALYDELREDINLRFGSPAAHAPRLADPATVLVTAPEAVTPAGVVLEPVLDLSVQ